MTGKGRVENESFSCVLFSLSVPGHINRNGSAWPGRDAFSEGDVSDRGEIIPVEENSKIEMHPAGGNNPCGEKVEARDAFSRPK